MSPSSVTGLALLIIGGSLVYLGLHNADALFFVQSAVLHFFEHMQEIWKTMAQTPRLYLAGGGVLLIIGLIFILIPGRRNPRDSEYL